MARTVNSEKLKKIGLPPNVLGFRITLISHDENENLYHVEASIPVGWTGKNSFVVKNNLNSSLKELKLDLEKCFLMTESEVLKYFNKFYVYPKLATEVKDLKLQDTFEVNNNKE